MRRRYETSVTHYPITTRFSEALERMPFATVQLVACIYAQQVQERLDVDPEPTIQHELDDVLYPDDFKSPHMLPGMLAYLIAAVQTYRREWGIPMPAPVARIWEERHAGSGP